MKMSMITIGPAEHNRVREVVKYAEAHPYTMKAIQYMIDHPSEELIPGNNPNFRMVFPPYGVTAVFTIDEQPIGWCRYLSMSSPNKGLVPNPAAVQFVAKLFGFTSSPKDWYTHLEDFAQGQKAVNVYELIEEKNDQTSVQA